MQATVRFKSFLQEQQIIHPDTKKEMLRSRINLDLDLGGTVYPDLSVTVAQPYGTRYEEAPLEVGRVQGYDGNLPYQAIARAAENYYRSVMTRTFGDSLTNAVMLNNKFISQMDSVIDIDESRANPW